MTDRRKAILVEAARDLAEMQEGSDAGWGLWYDWLDTVVRKIEREAWEVYEVVCDQAYDPIVPLPRTYGPGDRVRVVKEAP